MAHACWSALLVTYQFESWQSALLVKTGFLWYYSWPCSAVIGQPQPGGECLLRLNRQLRSTVAPYSCVLPHSLSLQINSKYAPPLSRTHQRRLLSLTVCANKHSLIWGGQTLGSFLPFVSVLCASKSNKGQPGLHETLPPLHPNPIERLADGSFDKSAFCSNLMTGVLAWSHSGRRRSCPLTSTSLSLLIHTHRHT